MNITPDYLIERKRNQKLLGRWKLIALFLIMIIFLVVGQKFGDKEIVAGTMALPQSEYIGSISIEEIIFEDLKREKRLAEIAEDQKVKALIVHMNSPGGSVVGAEMLYNSLLKVSEHKPVVVVMGSLATSGGYLASLGADHIISHNGTVTGSIGVIFQTAEVTELAEKLGVKFHNFKSGELKAAPNFAEKVTPEVHQAVMENIYDVYDYFVEQVAKRRKLSMEQAKKLADGRIYSGRQALQLGLVDAIGDEDVALKWLQDTKKIDKNLKIKEIKLRPERKYLEMLLEDMDSFFPGKLFGKLQGFSAIN